MGRNWTIDTHPQREAIVKELIKGDKTGREIARQYEITPAAISRYLNDRLIEKAAKVLAKRDEAHGTDFIAEALQQDERVQKLLDACDDYLRDPEDPSRYELGPRSWEIDIVYRTVEPDTDKMITRKESLQALLDKLDNAGYQPWEVRMKQADPRKLLLEASNNLRATLELRAKLAGKLIENQTTVNVNLNQYWVKFKQIILDATEKAPEVRARIIQAMEADNG